MGWLPWAGYRGLATVGWLLWAGYCEVQRSVQCWAIRLAGLVLLGQVAALGSDHHELTPFYIAG